MLNSVQIHFNGTNYQVRTNGGPARDTTHAEIAQRFGYPFADAARNTPDVWLELDVNERARVQACRARYEIVGMVDRIDPVTKLPVYAVYDHLEAKILNSFTTGYEQAGRLIDGITQAWHDAHEQRTGCYQDYRYEPRQLANDRHADYVGPAALTAEECAAMDAHFGYDRPLSDDEVEEMYALHQAETELSYHSSVGERITWGNIHAVNAIVDLFQ